MSHNLTPWQEDGLAGFTRVGQTDAPIVHLMHGNGFCSTTLWPLASHFPEDWNLLFADVPGHGLSEQPKGFMPNWLRIARKVGDGLEKRLEEFPGRKVIGVGHSMGGIMTLMLAAERPHLFERIILLDPIFFTPEIVWAQKFMRKTGLWRRSALVKATTARRKEWPNADSMLEYLLTKGLYKNWHEDALAAFIEDGTKQTAAGLELNCAPEWEASIFGSYPRGLWQAVRRVKVPVNIFVANASYGFIQRSANKAAKANANIQWQPFAGTHCFPMEQPLLAAQEVLKIVQ